jgi:hypothetical protein
LEERRSYSNFAGSAALHGAVLAAILFGVASAPRFSDSPEAIPIETVSVSDLNQIAEGEKDAKPAPPSAPALPPQPVPEPPPKPEVAQQPPQPTPPPKAETPPPKPAPPQKADAAPSPDSEPLPPERPQPPPPRTAALEAPVQPPVRPKDPAPEKPKEPTPEKPKLARNFDPNSIAKIIGQGKTPNQTALATPQGLPHHDAPRMSMSMASALDAWLTESYLNCWTPPPGVPEGDTYVAQIKVVFNPDGTLSGRPVLLNPPSDKAWRAHAESAMRAVHKCDPLKVPAQYMPYFDQWKIETIHFDPRESQG